MKKKYLPPVMEEIFLEGEDVIATSVGGDAEPAPVDEGDAPLPSTSASES